MLLTLLVFLVILSLLVLIHEAGHFFVAKKFGIKVEEFGYGLPPRAWGKKIGETLYSINWLPFGGFVKLYGEDEAGSGSVKVDKSELQTKDIDRAFFSRSVPQRAAVVVAGVVMNALLAIAIYYVYLGMSGFKTELPLLTDYKFIGVNQQNKVDAIITSVAPKSPAQESGIRPMSKVISVNNQPIRNADEFKKVVAGKRGEKLTILLEDVQTFKEYTVSVTPRVNPPKGQGAMGVSFGIPMAVLDYSEPVHKVFSGISHPINLMGYQFAILGTLFKTSIAEKDASAVGNAVSGPVGIYNVVGAFIQIPDARERVLQLLNLTGLLSLSLAFFNILPIPALDGGRLMFILIEGITKKKVSPKFEAMAHTIGMAVLLTLILLVTFKDIFQLFK